MTLQSPQIAWIDSVPRDNQYDDSYHSQHNGLEETNHVFIAGNGLPERWRTQDHWNIGETGFGTGLNFLSVWQSWHDYCRKDSRLVYVSSECHPLSRADLANALQQWPSLAEFSEQLIEQWPDAIGGFHSFSFDNGRVRLQLLFGDSEHVYSQLIGKMDAWLLDGFSPAKNPSMWHNGLYTQLARLSKANATLASFTSAGYVRRSLNELGFNLKKQKGYRYKRDMIAGNYSPDKSQPNEFETPASVAVIGGGLAGCSVAYALAKRGIKVQLFDEGKIAGKGSAIPAAVTRPFPDHDLSPAARLSIDGFNYSRGLFKQFGLAKPCGAQWRNLDSTKQFEYEFPKSLAEKQLIGGNTELYFPNAQTIEVAALCEKLIDHPAITVNSECVVTRISDLGSNWVIENSNGELSVNAVVIASGKVNPNLHPSLKALSSRPIRGQLSGFKRSKAPLDQIVCGHGHIARHNGTLWAGASFVPDDCETDIRQRDHQVYMDKLVRLCPDLAQQVATDEWAGWAGIRHTTADHLPLVGQLANTDKLAKRYAKQAPQRGTMPSDEYRVKGLYISVAHGSRGSVTAPISGELIAAQICQEPLPLPSPIVRAIDPARYPVRAIQRA